MKFNVLGFGVMGRQIAALLQMLGHDVTVWNREISESRMERYHSERRVLMRKLGRSELTGTFRPEPVLDRLPAGLTIEVLAEELCVKQKILSGLPYAIEPMTLFTNSSSLLPNEIHPQAHALHFFNPIHALRLVETTLPPNEVDGEVKQLLDGLQNLGIAVVRTNANRGFVGNYILFREISSALKLIDQYRYTTKTIDTVMNGIGRATSLFEVIDCVGIDVVKHILENLHHDDSSIYISPLLQKALELNILGRKNKTTIRTLIDHN